MFLFIGNMYWSSILTKIGLIDGKNTDTNKIVFKCIVVYHKHFDRYSSQF